MRKLSLVGTVQRFSLGGLRCLFRRLCCS